MLRRVAPMCSKIYQLDQVLQRPTLLVYTCYSIYFVCFYTTATNSMQFAYQVIIASTNSTDLPDQRVLRFIAVAITTLICLLLYFSTHTGRKINTYLCSYKLGLLITIFIAAAVKAGKEGLSNSDIDQNFDKSRISSVTALLSVLFSFQGWENATYVSILFQLSLCRKYCARIPITLIRFSWNAFCIFDLSHVRFTSPLHSKNIARKDKLPFRRHIRFLLGQQ